MTSTRSMCFASAFTVCLLTVPHATLAASPQGPTEQVSAKAQAIAGQREYDRAVELIKARDFDGGFKAMSEAAALGHLAAIGEMGSLYRYGLGVEKNPAQAHVWYRRAVDLGNAEAMHNQALMYYNAEGVEADAEQAVALLRRAAEQGMAFSQLLLGEIFFEGQVVQRDFQESRRWFERAAALGNAQAQASLGTIYLRGYGVEVDAAQSLHWFLQAAEQALPIAQYNVGVLLLNDEKAAAKIPRDADKAIEWLTRAAAQKHGQAALRLSEIYDEGKDVPRDAVKAIGWLEVGADSGQAEAQYRLGKRYADGKDVKVDMATARRWLGMAAQQGHLLAGFALSGLVHEQEALASVAPEAVSDVSKRAESGDTVAQAELGRMYRYGIGVPRDADLAIEWFGKAADKGLATAQVAVAELLLKRDEEPARAKAMDWLQKAAGQGEQGAALLLGTSLLHRAMGKREFESARKRFEQAYAGDKDTDASRDAAYMLGYMSFCGLGTREDLRAAVQWFRRALDDKPGRRFASWGHAHRYGSDLYYDPVLAYVWLTLAASNGEDRAAKNAAEVYKGLAPQHRLKTVQLLDLWKREGDQP